MFIIGLLLFRPKGLSFVTEREPFVTFWHISCEWQRDKLMLCVDTKCGKRSEVVYPMGQELQVIEFKEERLWRAWKKLSCKRRGGGEVEQKAIEL